MIKKAIGLFSDELQIKATLFRFVTNLPYFRDIKNEKIRDVEISIFKSIHGKTENLGYQTCMPKSSKSMVNHGLLYLCISQGDVLKLAESYDSGSMVSWKDGRMSGAVYPFNDELNDLLVEVRILFITELEPYVFFCRFKKDIFGQIHFMLMLFQPFAEWKPKLLKCVLIFFMEIQNVAARCVSVLFS